MEHYIDYLKALIGHLHHDAATYYANWKAAEAKAAADLEAAEQRLREEKDGLLARITRLEADVEAPSPHPAKPPAPAGAAQG